MSRANVFACWACGLFLVLLPAALPKPGLPLELRGDEATYLGLAGSLLEEQDLLFGKADAERVFSQFPFDWIEFRLVAGEGEQPPRYDGSLIYPLLAAPFLAVLGSNGLLVLNQLLLLGAMILATRFLARRGLGDGALLLAAPFVLLSPALIYAYWMRPSALLFFLGTAAFSEGWADERELPRWRRALAGAALGVAIAHVPYLALLALPLLARLWRQEKKNLPAFAVALVAAFVLVAALNQVSLGAIFPGHAGKTYLLEKPDEAPWRQAGALPATRVTSDPAPRPFAAKRLAYSLIERRRGFLPYFPLALLALLLWKTPRREGLLAAALLGAILLQPWAGELLPSLPMNPALLPLYPAFLIFVRRIPPLAVIAAAGVATALLGLQLVGLLGSQIPDGGPHGHVRALPYSRLPLDIEEVQPGSGLLRQKQSGDPPAPVLWAPADQAFASGRELWTFGSERVEFFLESEKPLQTILLQVRSMALPNRVELRHQGGKEQYDFARGANLSQRLLHLGQGETTTRGSFIYRFEVKSDHAAKPYWSGESGEEYYVGAALAYLGTEEEVNRDLYHLTWPSCGAPPQLEAGSIALALARARNTSSFSWPIEGAAQVRIASRWLDPAGNRVAENTFRADLFEEAKPGEEIKTWLKIKAPTTPGSYQLEFDAVFENIGWFSAKGAETCRQAVEVLPRSP